MLLFRPVPAKRRWLSLSHADDGVRQFSIDHSAKPAVAFRPISASNSAHHGDEHLDPGWYERVSPLSRLAPRQRLLAALDEVIGRAEPCAPYRRVEQIVWH
ncbi:L-rhamnose isomerase [Shigella flexneri]